MPPGKAPKEPGAGGETGTGNGEVEEHATKRSPASQLNGLAETPEEGLSAEEVASRLARFGRNELVERKTSKLRVFLKLV